MLLANVFKERNHVSEMIFLRSIEFIFSVAFHLEHFSWIVYSCIFDIVVKKKAEYRSFKSVFTVANRCSDGTACHLSTNIERRRNIEKKREKKGEFNLACRPHKKQYSDLTISFIF